MQSEQVECFQARVRVLVEAGHPREPFRVVCLLRPVEEVAGGRTERGFVELLAPTRQAGEHPSCLGASASSSDGFLAVLVLVPQRDEDILAHLQHRLQNVDGIVPGLVAEVIARSLQFPGNRWIAREGGKVTERWQIRGRGPLPRKRLLLGPPPCRQQEKDKGEAPRDGWRCGATTQAARQEALDAGNHGSLSGNPRSTRDLNSLVTALPAPAQGGPGRQVRASHSSSFGVWNPRCQRPRRGRLSRPLSLLSRRAT